MVVMRNLLVSSALAVVLLGGVGAANAGSGNTGIGLGVEALLNGPAGASLVYDAASFRVGGLFAFSDGNDYLLLGGRVFVPVHTAATADFSIGGGAALVHRDMGMNDADDFHIELLGQARVFLAGNVSLNAALGVSVVTGDGEDFLIGGNVLGSFGLTYYFY